MKKIYPGDVTCTQDDGGFYFYFYLDFCVENNFSNQIEKYWFQICYFPDDNQFKISNYNICYTELFLI